MSELIIRVILVGISIAAVSGPLGSLVVWRRFSYFGDTLAHATLMGAAIAVMLNVNLYLGVFVVALLVAICLANLTKIPQLANDALLATLAHGTLAIGLIISAKTINIQTDLLNYLLGDILSVNFNDIIIVGLTSIMALVLIIINWRGLLLSTLNQDLAVVSKVRVVYLRWLFIILLALIFSIAIKLIGILLMTALLIVPATASRNFSSSPEQMAVIASIIGGISVILGVGASFLWDWPTGPAIVVVVMIFFVFSLFKFNKNNI